MNKEINFGLAKLLKEKGFNEPCRFVHDNWNNIEDWYDIYGEYHRNSEKNASVYYSAPTISDVVDWIYVNHGFWIEVSKISGYQDLFFYTITGSKGFNHGNKITVVEWDDDKCDEMGFNNKYKNSPTEAYEDAIKYTLVNII